MQSNCSEFIASYLRLRPDLDCPTLKSFICRNYAKNDLKVQIALIFGFVVRVSDLARLAFLLMASCSSCFAMQEDCICPRKLKKDGITAMLNEWIKDNQGISLESTLEEFALDIEELSNGHPGIVSMCCNGFDKEAGNYL